jgi:hypothetical protein
VQNSTTTIFLYPLRKGTTKNTTATAVLIGSQTYARRWVRYEIIRSIYRGNKVIGVHINRIPDKHQRVKVIGLNPFRFLGFQFSFDGRSLKVYEDNGKRWIEYKDHDGWKLKASVPKKYRGNFYQLSSLGFPVYDWELHDGYENFAQWIED